MHQLTPVLIVLLYIWAAPNVLLVAPLIGLAWVFRQVRLLGWSEGALEWVITKDSWLARRRQGWTGMTIGWMIIYSPGIETDPVVRGHERVHIEQSLRLGPFSLFLYGVIYLAILVGCPGIAPYRDHPFEVEAYRREKDNQRS